MRDLDLGQPDVVDGRRLEVIVDGLPLHSGAQLAVDTTLVCALHRDGIPVGRAAQQDGVVLQSARALAPSCWVDEPVPSWLSSLCRWSEETRMFLSLLARAKVRGENPLLRKRVQQAWRLRWGALLSCTTACAVASSMLELPGARGADGDTPAQHGVEQDFRLAGLVE